MPGLASVSAQCAYSSSRSIDFAFRRSRTMLPITSIRQTDFFGLSSGFRPSSANKVLFSRIGFECRAEGSSLRIGQQIETDRLSSSVRELTMKSIDNLGGRVTVGDVAASAGLKVSEAQNALQALAADTGGFLEVSDEGDVLYVFPKDYRVKLLAKSFRLKLEPLLIKLKKAGDYLVRISFGTTLIASLVVVYTSIFFIIASGRSQEDSRSERSYSSRNSGLSFNINIFDLFWSVDPYRVRRNADDLNFLESVFSFVFGDGDPNDGREEIRWQEIANQISSKGGVVTAEEIAPFLDVPPLKRDSNGDESFVLPVLLRFDGKPEVDSEGNILYRFPSLQRTGSSSYLRSAQHFNGLKFFKELPLKFSRASNQFLVIALGAFNLVGVLTLTALLQDDTFSGIVLLASNILPVLQVYTAAFFAIPLVRWLILNEKNKKIEARNMARKERAVLVQQQPDPDLQKKLEGARKMAERTFIGKDRIVYTTEKDLLEQDYQAKEWDSRFEERTR